MSKYENYWPDFEYDGLSLKKLREEFEKAVWSEHYAIDNGNVPDRVEYYGAYAVFIAGKIEARVAANAAKRAAKVVANA